MTKLIYTKEQIIEAYKTAKTKTELMRNLGLRNVGSNYRTLDRYVKLYNLDISTFIKHDVLYKKKTPIEDILVQNSNFSRTHLKKKLYNENYKKRKCELCGQDENWNGKHMSLILDHINGIWNDNRIENLRIVCPNCNATLDTHAGKNKRQIL